MNTKLAHCVRSGMVGPAGGNRGRWAAAGGVSAKSSTFRRRLYLCNCGGVHHSAPRASVARNPLMCGGYWPHTASSPHTAASPCAGLLEFCPFGTA